MQDQHPLEQRNPATLIQLHIAEYQALTMRNTYWITMQYFLWPILIGLIGLVTQLHNPFDPALRIWGIAIVIEVVVVAYYAATLEQYSNVRYIETELKPSISVLVGPESFWGYEPYLKASRPFPAWLWEMWPLLLLFGCIVFPIGKRWSFLFLLTWGNWGHWAAALSDCALGGFAIISAWKAIRLRRSFFSERQHVDSRPDSLPLRAL
jgi:hypothetical protein